MSLIKSIMHQLGLSGDPEKNFTLSVPAAPDGTMKLARGNAGATTQDIMTVDAAGRVAFPKSIIQPDTAGFAAKFAQLEIIEAKAGTVHPIAITIDALGKLAFPGQGQSLAGNGYVKLPGGLIVQWGNSAAGAAGSARITLPTPFTVTYRVVASVTNLNASASANANGFDLASFDLSARTFANTFSPEVCSWIAIGY